MTPHDAPLIGLSGYARSGKDAAAAALTAAGWTRRAYADTLRDFAYALNPVIVHSGRNYRLARLVDAYGWSDELKKLYPETREFLQVLGTEAGRKVLGEHVWRDRVLNTLQGPTVITDVRYPEEADGIRERGGIIVRIVRPGVTAANAHVSETAMDDYAFDAVIANDGDLATLHARILATAATQQMTLAA